MQGLNLSLLLGISLDCWVFTDARANQLSGEPRLGIRDKLELSSYCLVAESSWAGNLHLWDSVTPSVKWEIAIHTLPPQRVVALPWALSRILSAKVQCKSYREGNSCQCWLWGKYCPMVYSLCDTV